LFFTGSSATTYIIACAKRHTNRGKEEDHFPALSFIGEEIPHPWRIFSDRNCGGEVYPCNEEALAKAERKNGPDVWQFRWPEKGGDGRRVDRKGVIGTIEQYSDAAAAQQLAARIIARPKSLDSRPAPPMTIAEFCEHFQHHELAQSDAFRSHSTRRNYIFYLNKWIIPRWQDYELADVRTVEVEAWLRSLPLARSTCAKIRNLMSVVFNHALRHEFSAAILFASCDKARKDGGLRTSYRRLRSNHF
jgi:hypothetical protein